MALNAIKSMVRNKAGQYSSCVSMLLRCEIGPWFSFWYSDSQSTVEKALMLLDL